MRIFSLQFFAFLSLFVLVFGGMNAFFFVKWRDGIMPRPRVLRAGLILAGLLVFAPMVVPRATWFPSFEIRRIVAFGTYFWMGFLLEFCFIAGLLDLVFRFFRLIRRLLPSFLQFEGSPALVFWGGFAVAVSALGWGFFEARSVGLEEVVIESGKLPENIRELKIVQVSDVHLSILDDVERLERILAKVREAAPDLLVMTGDLFDGQLRNPEAAIDLLMSIKPRFGKYAVTGNHEVYAGLDVSAGFIEAAGFKLLRDEAFHSADGFNIAGVDDDAVRQYGGGSNRTEKEILSTLPREFFTILLKHRPWLDSDALYLFDLQLSGHTHGGQIFPFGFVTWLANRFNSGLFRFGEKFLHVSRGSGTWGPPVRVFTPPVVTLLRIKRPE